MAAFDEKEYTKAFDLKIWKRLLPILARYKKAISTMVFRSEEHTSELSHRP